MPDLPVTSDAPALTLPDGLVEWVQNSPPEQVGAGAGAPVVRPVRRTVQTFGGAGYHVEEPGDLVRTFRQALDDPRVACVNVTVDPDFVVQSGAAKLTV